MSIAILEILPILLDLMEEVVIFLMLNGLQMRANKIRVLKYICQEKAHMLSLVQILHLKILGLEYLHTT